MVRGFVKKSKNQPRAAGRRNHILGSDHSRRQWQFYSINYNCSIRLVCHLKTCCVRRKSNGLGVAGA
jgi:hypothetical protein